MLLQLMCSVYQRKTLLLFIQQWSHSRHSIMPLFTHIVNRLLAHITFLCFLSSTLVSLYVQQILVVVLVFLYFFFIFYFSKFVQICLASKSRSVKKATASIRDVVAMTKKHSLLVWIKENVPIAVRDLLRIFVRVLGVCDCSIIFYTCIHSFVVYMKTPYTHMHCGRLYCLCMFVGI